MTDITNVRPRAADLLAQNRGTDLYRRAYAEGKSLSVWLEEQDPSDGYKDGLDAFGRLMKAAGIRTRSFPELGVFADRFEAFERSPEAWGLVPEFVARQWRRAAQGRDVSTRSLFLSDSHAPGNVMHPYVNEAQARMQQMAPAIPLSEMVAITTGIDGDAYRAFYLTEPATADKQMVRVAEGAEIPRVTLTGGDHTIRLKKYGRALEASYEMLRRQPIDLVALHIARMAIQAETDKVATALDVIINGDGNASTAATSHNLTTLDTAASAGTLTLKGWLAFKLQFANPYAITTAIVQSDVALQMMLLNVGSANVPLVAIQGPSGFGGFTPINPELSDQVRLGITSAAPSLKIVGFDRRFAVQQLYEVGADITEVERFVTRQTQALVMSEIVGFAVLDQQGARVLDVNA